MIDWDSLIHAFLEKNKQINLSAIRDEEGVMIKHIQDSLELEKIIEWKE
jgi:16S rRNA G527 N7-methylase RsmG